MHLWFPQIYIRLRKGGLTLATTRYFFKLRPKKAWNYAYLARKIHNFLRLNFDIDRKETEIVHALPPCNPQNRIYTHKFWQKRDWKLWIYGSQKCILLRKEVMPPCDHQKSYISEFRAKRAWNYAYLARKIQNFLRLNFDRKETEIIVHIMVPQNTHSFKKRKAAPLQPPNSYISVNSDQKGPEIMHIKLVKYKIFLGKGVLPPCNPKSDSSVSWDQKGPETKLCIIIYLAKFS